MAEIVIGRSLDRLKIKLVQNSQQAFALAWMSGSSPADISAYTFTIVLDDGTVWTATKNTNNTTWTLTAVQANIGTGFHSGRLLATDINGPMVVYDVAVEVQ